MTDLTEQWKKGEFIICNAGKCQYYYVQNEEQKEVIKTEYCLFDDNTPNWQILAPVPSYEEWKQAQERLSKLEKMKYSYTPEEWNIMLKTVNHTREQNAQLKELLKEFKDYLPEFETPMDILAKIDEALQ